ncbi:Not1 N-terminal domain, CCR4-Not complex component-domain-containing protein [Colletotrichum godetiae]|uniref:General negative regulator of transcription subunit n=1 Tax=Colletotrichum godetiae TaxID=1209918 RepID=A0AAJ0F4F4_9PEZI|nr:Not1 N-terminal domain, CCR4-Not complex component-domain-containing protein [Colletotrichum godetiae]KAK1700426.1 Not1 N-terminal domain, CCR4-Not complex component-domain-containing protein [Colletotrichum godetiae]
MAARKLQQEVDKCFKKVAEGVAEFEAIYEKIEQSNNISQKEKLEDNLKREIKKLQRLRDQIKTWAASNDIKDKSPLLEHRRLIETQMEKFKAVEKAMKTKAYSKEGLASSAKLDPQEQAKAEASDFLNNMVDELEQQIETLEAEAEAIQATMKKGKSQTAKAERMAEIERIIERHKWHQGKLELIRRSLENGGVDTDQVTDLEETIRYYVSDGMNDDFVEDEEMYEELALDEDEGAFGVPADGDKGSSQDAQSIAEEPTPEPEIIKAPPKPKAVAEASASGRRSSSQNKSPLPALATLHMPTIIGNGAATGPTMKPAVAPARPAEGLKYASAAAAAAASDKIGISPLPPPPGAAPVTANTPGSQSKTSATSSPATTSAHPVAAKEPEPKQPPAPSTTATESPIANPSASAIASTSTTPSAKAASAPTKAEKRAKKEQAAASASGAAKASQTNGATNGVKPTAEEEEESVYHLPSSLQDLVESFEASRKRPAPFNSPSTQRMLQTSQATCPDIMDADVPRTYRPDLRLTSTGVGFPQEPLPLFDDPRLYSRIDPDTLFYVFYYKQGTPQQYLAAKALKDQSWRFHKQYQTWFQRHEEPKNITEEFEQGTYRFFDYESTWMNRRKADFKFAYKFLEDDV